MPRPLRFEVPGRLDAQGKEVTPLGSIPTLPAGLDAQATIGVNSLPLTPWQGLGVVALWAVGALLLGALVLKFRDA